MKNANDKDKRYINNINSNRNNKQKIKIKKRTISQLLNKGEWHGESVFGVMVSGMLVFVRLSSVESIEQPSSSASSLFFSISLNVFTISNISTMVNFSCFVIESKDGEAQKAVISL